jgi:hypothetical protein
MEIKVFPSTSICKFGWSERHQPKLHKPTEIMEAKAQRQVHIPVMTVSIIFMTVRTVFLWSARIGIHTTLFIKELVLLSKLLAPVLAD